MSETQIEHPHKDIESAERGPVEPVDGALLQEMVTDTLSDTDVQQLLKKIEEVGRETRTEPLHVLHAVVLELKETGGALTPDGLLTKLDEFREIMTEDEEKEGLSPGSSL